MKKIKAISTVAAWTSRALFCGALFVGGIAQATTDYTWSGPTPATTTSPAGGTWDTTSDNWNDGTAYQPWVNPVGPTAANTNIATFGGTDSSATSIGISLATAISANSLQFTSATDNYTISATSPETITLYNTSSLTTGTGGAIQVANGATGTIGSGVTVSSSGNNTFDITGYGTPNNTGVLDVSGALIGTGTSKALEVDDVAINVLSGGSLTSGNLQLSLATTSKTGSYAALNVEGGTVNTTSTTNFVLRGGAGVTDVVTVGSGGTGGTINANGINVNFAGGAGGSGALYLDSTGLIENSGTITATAGTSNFYMNGGTLEATGSTATFLQGLTAAYVGGNNGSGGAVISTSTSAVKVTIAQALTPGNGATGSTNTFATPDGGLTFQGPGTLILSGANTYYGGTTVNGGTLGVTGSLNAAGGLAVNAGAGFALGEAAGGSSFLSQTVSTLSLTSTGGVGSGNEAILAFNLGSGNDFLASTGAFTLTGSSFNLDLTGTASGTYELVEWATAGSTALTTGNVDLTLNGVSLGLNNSDLSIVTSGSNDILEFNASPVPEPATWAMMLAGLGLLAFRVSRKKLI